MWPIDRDLLGSAPACLTRASGSMAGRPGTGERLRRMGRGAGALPAGPRLSLAPPAPEPGAVPDLVRLEQERARMGLVFLPGNTPHRRVRLHQCQLHLGCSPALELLTRPVACSMKRSL